MRRNLIPFVFIIAIVLLLVSCGGETKNNSPEDISSINEKRTVQILIDYERSSLSYNDDATIYLDETEIGNISAGKSGSFQITIETGQHCIQAKGGTVIRHNNSSIIQFTIDDTTQDITFSLKDNSITGLTLSLLTTNSKSDQKQENTGISDPASVDESAFSYAKAVYEAYLQEIEKIKTTNPIDMDRLWETYQGLLVYRMYEMWFRVYAEDYYTGELGSSVLIDELTDECAQIEDEMREYFDSDSVDAVAMATSVETLSYFVDCQYPFETYEILIGDTPNIDAMWEKRVQSELERKSKSWSEDVGDATIVPQYKFDQNTTKDYTESNHYNDSSEHSNVSSIDISGDWQDSWSERCCMTITADGDNYYNVEVSWASSALECDTWTFSGYYDSSTGQLSYENGIWVTFDESNTEGSDDGSYIVLTDMSGTLTYENNVMHWDDFTSRLLDMDFGSTNMRFEKI